MAGITGLSTTFDLPNYHGQLIELTPTDTPLLSASGGLNGGKQVADTIIEWQSYDLRDPQIRPRLEGADAPTAEARVRANVSNRVQIFHEKVSTTYTKQAAVERYAADSANTGSSGPNPVRNEHAWQIMQSLKQIARDVNYTMWHGKRVDPADNTTARQMRGMFEAVTTNAVDKDGRAPLTGASTSGTDVTVTHDLVVGDKVVFTDVSTATAIKPHRSYWVTAISTTTAFKVSDTKGGTAITLGSHTGLSLYAIKQESTVSVDDINSLLQKVWDNGGISEQGTATLFVPSGQKLALTKAYASVYGQADAMNETRNVGGLDLRTIVTDFGTLNLAVERAMAHDAIFVTSLEQIDPVFLNIPGKGVLFEEELAKTGASENTQIYGELGMVWGNEMAHGVLRGLFA